MLILTQPKGLSGLAELQRKLLLPQATAHSIGGREQHYVITAKSRGGFILWQGNFYDEKEVWAFWRKLSDRNLGYEEWAIPTPHYDPSLNELPSVSYELATVTQFTSVGSTTYTPAGSGIADILVIGGGASGGGGQTSGWGAGGGGAGGFRKFLARTLSVLAYTVIVGAAGASVAAATPGNPGSLSKFDTDESAGGGRGGYAPGNVPPNANHYGGTGGCGGGHGSANTAGTVVGALGNTPSTSPSQGNDGGPGQFFGSGKASGGGGKGAPGDSYATAAADGIAQTLGGVGQADSITGSSVTYCEGGSGSYNAGVDRVTMNRGDGGHGGYDSNNTGKAGSTGLVVVSITLIAAGFNLAMMGI